jgi:type IV pilus assembly protein PilO
MAEFKIPDDPRSRGLLVGAFLMVAAVGAYWYMYWKPDHEEILVIAAHADTLEQANDKVRELVKNGAEKKLRADAERYTAELAVLRRLVPTENEVNALINSISTAARKTGMEVNEYSPDGVLPGDFFDAMKFHFGVIGPYHKVAEFLTEVASLDRIITPINVNITGVASAKGERKPSRNEVFVNVQFGVITYVAKTKPLPTLGTAPKPKTSGGGQ